MTCYGSTFGVGWSDVIHCYTIIFLVVFVSRVSFVSSGPWKVSEMFLSYSSFSVPIVSNEVTGIEFFKTLTSYVTVWVVSLEE